MMLKVTEEDLEILKIMEVFWQKSMQTGISMGNWTLTYWLHGREACITHAIEEVEASQGRNQVHNQVVVH